MTKAAILSYLDTHHGGALRFWTAGRTDLAAPTLLAACDALYALHLLGEAGARVTPEGRRRFAALLGGHGLQGGLNRPGGNGSGHDAPTPTTVHLTAYALGVLNLLKAHGHDLYPEVLAQDGWRIDALVDTATLLPRWPRRYGHHSWRVSHWVGGAPSILLSLARHAPDGPAKHALPPVDRVLAASDALIDPATGCLRCYRFEPAQRAFRLLYRMRHDPLAGDVGGIAHLHWVNHAAGRPFRAPGPLMERTAALLRRRPFIERVPYCLDFDVVQLARVLTPHVGTPPPGLDDRLAAFARDLSAFFAHRLDGSYALHKLPGALACLHECTLFLGADTVEGLGIAPVDVIRDAHWL